MGRGDALVLFGATGDLARKKLFGALYHLTARGLLDVPVIGVARSDWNDDQFRDHARDAIRATVEDVDGDVVERLCARLTLFGADYADQHTFEDLATRLENHGVHLPVFYLAIPPGLFPTVAEGLARARLNETGRIIVEKPFGRDLQSARELNRLLRRSFAETAIFRIDHFLGKEAVEDLLVFRFANTFLEPIWNRRYVSAVQVTMAENFGIQGRGAFYDGVGALRDVVQNHLLQVVAMLAMEPPVSPDADALRDEKVKVLKAMRPLDCSTLVRGQYDGYLDEPGVAPGSNVETYVACKFEIESWRWAGVPFYVRTGKLLPVTTLEAVVELHDPPRLLFADPDDDAPRANAFRFRLGAHDGVSIAVQAKRPGPGLCAQRVELSVDFASTLGTRQDAYERLLGDALDGNPRRFAREDGVENAWRVVQPAIDNPGPLHRYAPGSWGPTEADTLLDRGSWYAPNDAG